MRQNQHLQELPSLFAVFSIPRNLVICHRLLWRTVDGSGPIAVLPVDNATGQTKKRRVWPTMQRQKYNL